jgi:hypothetical protein
MGRKKQEKSSTRNKTPNAATPSVCAGVHANAKLDGGRNHWPSSRRGARIRNCGIEKDANDAGGDDREAG